MVKNILSNQNHTSNAIFANYYLIPIIRGMSMKEPGTARNEISQGY
jgi:hypothetical protein